MLSHGVDKWYKMQCGSGILEYVLAWRSTLWWKKLQTRMIKEDLPEAHEMEGVRITVFCSAIVIDVIVRCHTAGAL